MLNFEQNASDDQQDGPDASEDDKEAHRPALPIAIMRQAVVGRSGKRVPIAPDYRLIKCDQGSSLIAYL